MSAKIDTRNVDVRRAVVSDGDLPYGKNPVMQKCPEHADDAASMAIYPGHIVCYGCGFSVRRRMEALAWLLKLPSWREAAEIAGRYLILSETARQAARQSSRKVKPPSPAQVAVWQDVLHDPEVCGDRKQWLRDRGFTEQTINIARLGHTGASFVIPVYDRNMRLVTLRYRNDEAISGKYREHYDEDDEVVKIEKVTKYWGTKGCNDAILYPEWRFAQCRKTYAITVEGEFDALRLWQEVEPALTITNGAGQQHRILALLDEFFKSLVDQFRRPPIKHLIVCGDRDEPGIKAARSLFQTARGSGQYERVTWVQWHPAMGKDITEFMQRSGLTFKGVRERYEFEEEMYV